MRVRTVPAMKVKDCIARLKGFPPDAEVVISGGDDEGFDPAEPIGLVHIGDPKIHKSGWRSLYPPQEGGRPAVVIGFSFGHPDYVEASKRFDEWLLNKNRARK
jgi:hypothetical protein